MGDSKTGSGYIWWKSKTVYVRSPPDGMEGDQKNGRKKGFTGYARVERTEDTKEEYGASAYLYFKLWAKGNYRRIYINDYKRRTIGYIENGEVAISNRQGVSGEEIEYAVNKFSAEYAF